MARPRFDEAHVAADEESPMEEVAEESDDDESDDDASKAGA